MSLKLVNTCKNHENNSVAKIYKDTQWGEYVVKFTTGTVYQRDADYHTDDYEDACNTASKATGGEF